MKSVGSFPQGNSTESWRILPDPDNRVTVNREGKIVLTYNPNSVEAYNHLQDRR